MFLVEGGTTDVDVVRGITTEVKVDIDASGVVFSIGFLMVEVEDFSLVLPFETRAK